MASAPFSASFFSPLASFPDFPDLNLSDEEQAMANMLAMRLFETRPYFDLRWLYYDAEQRFRDLGISITPALNKIRPALSWSQIGVDALVHRTVVEGFRFPGETEVNPDLMRIWHANKLDAESPMAHLETFVSGRSYIIVGPGDESTDGEPLITAESPINMAAHFDARTRTVTHAVQIYYDGDYSSDQYGAEVAALYLPGQTIHLQREGTLGVLTQNARWEVTSRDRHGQDAPVVRMVNRERLSNRVGLSEINAAWMNTVDSACRTLLGAEISRELHAAPRRYALGVGEADFQNPDGTPVSKLKAYMDLVWLLERDADGNLPQIGEFAGADPSPYTKLIQMYREEMALHMSVPPSMMSIHATNNPASADAIRSGYEELTQKSRGKQPVLGIGWKDAMRKALQIRGGSVPENANMLELDWCDPAPSTPIGTSTAITSQIAAGAIPPASDATLKKLGWSPVERAQLAQDREVDQGQSFLNEIASALTAKDARTDKTLLSAAGAPVPTADAVQGKAPVPTPAQVFGGKNRAG